MAPQYPMVTALSAFIDKLKRRDDKGLEVQAHFFEDENYFSAVPATISKGLRFVYSTAAAKSTP